MKKSNFTLATMSLLALIVIPFQNCSLYKSEDRKRFESEGVQMILDRAEAQAQAQAAANNNNNNNGGTAKSSGNNSISYINTNGCEPLISATEASQIFSSADLNAELFLNPSTQVLTCLLSSNSETATNDSNTAVCTLTVDNLAKMTTSEELRLQDPHVNGELSGGSFGIIHSTEAGETASLEFVGRIDGGQEALSCRFTFENIESLEAEKSSVLSRSSLLVHKMAEALQ